MFFRFAPTEHFSTVETNNYKHFAPNGASHQLMIVDLSKHHDPITNLFPAPGTAEKWKQYRLTKDQVDFFHTNGYLAGIHLLNDEQIEALRAESAELMDPAHPANDLFYEFHSNESADPSKV